MSTVNIVPRADNEGSVGTERKKWSKINAYSLQAEEVRAVTISAADIKKDGKSLVTADEVVGSNPIRRPNTAYAIGDIAYSPLLPSWARLECVKAGTTASTEIQIPQNVNGGGR